jgi:Xaa-Pro dipeptidase
MTDNTYTQAPPRFSYQKRQEKLAGVIVEESLDAFILNPGPSLTYFTGLHFHLSERPIIIIFTNHTAPIIVLPELETAKTTSLSFPVMTHTYGENPASWQKVFDQAFDIALSNPAAITQSVGVEPRQLRYLELQIIQGAAPNAQIVPGDQGLSSIRMIKEEGEIVAMRKAVGIAQNALLETIPYIKTGVTERQIANELTGQLLKAGSDPQFPFSPIVSGGPNSANPHATPTDRPLMEGDLLVIDWGASHRGYISDITRTFAIGKADTEFTHIAKIVEDANKAGRSVIKPGLPACEVDHASRSVIDNRGYGEYFTHRTGHGIGMEGHEPPYIRDDNQLNLIQGMTFTVEPGIYLPDRGGVRIEDNVLVTDTGVESLTNLPRALQVLGV